MNLKIIKYYIGYLIKIEAVLMVIPILCSLIYREVAGLWFLIVGVVAFLLGYFLSYKKPKNQNFFTAESFATVALGWIFLSLIGALPFFLSGHIPNYLDAIFETVSGFTTTGATIVDDVESFARCMLLWRSFTHFVGGMGVLVLILALLPTQSDNMLIMKAEAPGHEVERLVPHVKDTAKMLYNIYLSLTILTIVCYFISGMPLFDAICIGLGTAGTGGFTVLNTGCSSYNTVSQSLITFFMIVFGVNFNIYFLILIKKAKVAFLSEEFRTYIRIILVAAIIITINITLTINEENNILLNFHRAMFTVASSMTTTGYSIFDYTVWPMTSRLIVLLVMFIGGCAGSTAGGFKVSRGIIAIKQFFLEIYLQLHPEAIVNLKFEGKKVSDSTRRTVNAYFIVYFIIFTFALFLISFENYDFETTFSAVAETFNNIGMGLSKIGPKHNFNIFSYNSKIIFTILMLIGRLEIFPIIILFSPKTWNRKY